MTRRTTLGLTLASAALLTSACGGNGNSGEDCAANLLAGDLVITEIMANPTGADEGAEYFEIFNATTAPINLTGLALISSKDDGTGEDVHVMREATIAAGQYFVVGGILDEFKEAYMDYGAANDLSFRNSDGKLALRCKEVLVDETTYATAPDGASLELNGAEMPNSVRNDEEANYCESVTEFAPDFFGSPQAANSVCGNVTPGMCDDNGTMRPTVAPVLGDVVITEFMPNPEGADGESEWIEVLALADFDANGLSIARADGGSGAAGTVSDSACVSVTAGELILFASNDDELTNGGLPTVDATFGFSLLQSDGSIQAAFGETILDVVTWPASTSGVSINLDPRSSDPVGNDNVANFCAGTSPYGDAGNLGTPGLENSGCVAAGECLDAGTPRPIVPATNIRITEVMTRTNGDTDANKRWFEVRFDVAGDLNELEVGRGDGTTNSTTITSATCVPVAAGGFVILARSSDLALNGLPRIDGLFNFTLPLTGDRLFAGFNGVELDAVEYPTTPVGDAGTSQQKDDADDFCTSAAAGAGTYGAEGNVGTPGAASLTCPP